MLWWMYVGCELFEVQILARQVHCINSKIVIRSKLVASLADMLEQTSTCPSPFPAH